METIVNLLEQAPVTGLVLWYMEDDSFTHQKSHYQSITSDSFYHKWSFEELRLRDYETGNRWSRLPDF